MASGEQLVDDLFGFAELTGENVATACKTSVASRIADKKAEVAPKFHLEKEQIKRDTDEVIVPILFEKSGVKKYKVLARHQVEDDEDIRRPGSSERSSPNSEEQRKENINIKQSCDNVQKKKLDVKRNIKRQKVKGIENTVGEHSLKKLKKSQNARKWIDKIKVTKGKVKKDEHVESKEKKVTAGTDKDPRAVSYDFQDELDLHLKLHDVKSSVKGISHNEDKLKACDSRAVEIQNTFEFRSSEEKVKQKPLKVECLVKLRRDPSIEIFYKTLSDNESAVSNSCDSVTSDTAPKKENLGTVMESECNKCLDTDENKTASHQNSSDENRLKMTDMIYNADIQVRKSGRLQSAKCASRYRGDYGIRKDTYKQLVNKTISTSCAKDNSGNTDNKPDERGNCKASDVEKSNCQEQLDYEYTSQIETGIPVDESKTLVNRLTIPAETYSNLSSDPFTVLRDPDVIYSMAETMLSKTEACSSNCNLVGKGVLDNKDCENRPLMECEEGRKEGTCILLGYSLDSDQSEEYIKKCEYERKEVSNRDEGSKNMMTVYQNYVNRQNIDILTEDNNEKTRIQKCCETCDNCSNLTETVCTVVSNEVPSQVIKEIESCIPITLTEKSNCRNEKKDLIDKVINHEVDQETSNFNAIRTEVQAETKCIKSVESEDSKEKNNETVIALQKNSNDINKDRSGYVHSVGKSVNKIQKRMEIKKPVSSNMKGSSYPDISPESSPVKDTATVLESLRQKLFESAGADVVEADKVPKQFESKLISSKQRQSTDIKLPLMADVEEKQLRESDSSSGRSGKSTPRCSTPRSEPSTVILEEVAKSLNVLHKAKRKNDSKQKPSKRHRFEEKKFLLRSMKKTIDDAEIETKDTEIAVEHSVDISVVAGKIHERRRSSRNSAENNYSCFDSVNAKSNVSTSDVRKKAKKPHILEKTVAKPKPVKCSACSHIFKTKELLRKHFPCRIRQTRTWSQNKLRPNRAVKRAENSSKKFVCKLPKPGKSEASISRPQLLTYRKTKFRKVKGKRRRRLYQLIQDLRQKRMPVKWPHLSVVFDDLSFKEQCLYNLGLICVGNASEGLERYTAEEITVFEQHRAKERWMTEDAQTFEHSIPDSLGILNDVNVSTEISTDNQESDFCSPKSVINFPQVNIDDISCDNGSTTEETFEGASNEEKLKIESCVKDTLEITDTFCSQSLRTTETKEREIPWCLSYIQELAEKEDNSYEEVVEFEDTPEIIKANISIQDYASYVRYSDMKDRDNVTPIFNVVADMETIPKLFRNCKTLTNVRESSIQVETVQEISSIGKTALSVEIDMEKNFLHKAVATEVDVCSTETDYAHEENFSGSSDVISNQDNEKLCIQELSKPGFEIRRELISSPDCSSSSRNEQAISVVFDDISQISHDNKLELNSSDPKEEYEQDTFSHVSSHEQCSFIHKEKPVVKEIGSSKLEVSKSFPVNIGRITSGIKTKEHMKSIPVKKALPPAPDIELFHQTATIDETYLVSNSMTVPERVSEKDLDSVQSCLQEEGNETKDNTSTMTAEIHQNIIRQASGMLEDILEDVEHTVTGIESKCMPSTTASRFKDIGATSDVCFLKGLNLNTSPVKGILKSPKEFTPLSASSPVISPDRKDSSKENSVKSPAKKKIDFKTYAKRKGMIKDKDDKDREYMRSESHEIEDGLLNRLLDAVNVIDSIIEEHKDHIKPEDDTFSAITPEMAFEAAMLRNKIENTDEEESSKLYDIESIYTSSEGGNIMDVKETSTTTFTHASVQNESKVSQDTNAGGSSGNTGINSYENDSQLNEKVNITNINNIDIDGGIQEDFENKILKDIEVFDSSFTSTMNEANSKPFMNRNQQPEQDTEETFESEAVFNSTGNNENLIESSLEKIKEGINNNTDEMLLKPNSVFNLLKDAEPVDEPISKNDERLSMDKYNAKIASSENANNTKRHDDDEGMKSPEYNAKGEKDSSSSTIKESKKDFTIKYEMNGIVVKENLLTGDKNVVENSSPFRSSAESGSNCEPSLQSDLDISIVENNNCFYSKTNTDDLNNISTVSLKADLDQIRKIEEYDVLPCHITPVSDQNAVCYEETDLSCSLEVISEVNLDTGNKTSSEIKSLQEDAIITKRRGSESMECIDFSSVAQLSKEKETSVVKNCVEENFKLASCVEIEPLPLACIKVSRNICDDQSVGSPPVLEKVDTETNGIDKLNEDFSSQDLKVYAKVEPPILEPQHLKENEHGIEEQNELKTSQKTRTERHFLDVLGIVDNKLEDVTTIPSFERKQELISQENDTSEGNTILEKLYSDEKDQDDAIGRHFSDAVSENVNVPKTPKSKLQFLLDKSEKGEVTLSQIRDILTPFSKKGKEICIPNESLLKIKSGIANLLRNVKTPVRKDPSWLKRDAFSDYSMEKKLQRNLYYSKEEKGENDTSCEESCSDQEEIDYVSNDTLVPSEENLSQEDIETGVNTPSRRSVADTILQMLTSLEDKGSIADNMSNLLDILAENLGFLGKGSVDKDGYESSSESDYEIGQNGERMLASDSDSTKRTQRDLIANYLVEGDEPPSLDDIPTAGTRDACWSKDFLSTSNTNIKGNFENEGNTDSFECSLSESEVNRFDLKKAKENIELDRIEQEPCRTYTSKEVSSEKLSEPTYSIKKKLNDADICVDLTEPEGRRSRFEDDSNSFLSFSESRVTNDEAKDQKGKASTIFKSITELNSIETDEESNSGDSFDPVSMSVRLSELKALAKENTTWEFNSEFDSDQNDSDKFESDFENEAEDVSKDDSTTQLMEDDVGNSLANHTCCKLERSLSVDNEDSEMFEKCDSQKERLISKTRRQSVESSVEGKTDGDETEFCLETKETLHVLSDKNIKKNQNLKCEEDVQKCKSPPEKIRVELVKEYVPKGDEYTASSQVPLSSLLRPVETIEKSFSENKPSTNDSSQISLTSYTESTNAIYCNEKAADVLSETILQENSYTQSETNNKNAYLPDKIIKNGDNILEKDLNCTQVEPIATSKEMQCKCDSIKENKTIAQLEEKSRGKKYEEYDTEETNNSYIDDLGSEADTRIDTDTRIDENNDQVDSNKDMIYLHSGKEKMGEKGTGRSSDFDPQLHRKHESYDENINENDTLDYEKAVFADDEDTNETVAYNDELVESKTDFNGLLKDVDITEDNVADKLDGNCLQIEHDKAIPTLGKRSQESNSQIRTSRSLATDRKENDNRTMTVPVSFKNEENYELSSLDLQHAKLEENENNLRRERHETKQRSTSFNIDSSDISDLFCETIAEKVKRNQRDRSKSVCYSFNPWLYYSAAYVREVTKPTKKEISVFRSSILEKRAREKSNSLEKDDEICTPRKKRNSSVPKDADLSYPKSQQGRCVSVKNKTFVQQPPFHTKPCTVLIPKLTEKMIDRFTSRKRKSEEEPPSENRPPIKVTIKLSQIVYPPNSPYGSTSVSSDACRSGYESCSEESESDTDQQDCKLNLDCRNQKNANSDIKFSTESNEHGNGIDNTEVDLSFREPIKIKMRTLLTKMNSCEEKDHSCEEKDHQNFIRSIDQSEQLSVSLNESSSDTNIGGCSRELIESEVLHDIKQECEKVKSKDKDVLFYLSDSESEITPNVRKKVKTHQNKEKTEIYDLGVNVMPETSISPICGESDVDLSDSDTDTDIQMQIDEILNSRSIENFSQDTMEDKSSLKKDGKTAIMNMIESDLRLSESESESETDTLKKSRDNFSRKEIFKNSFDTKFEESYSEKNGQAGYKLPQTGIHNKELIMFSYPGLSKPTNKNIEKSVVTDLDTQQNKDFHTGQNKVVKSLKLKHNPMYASGLEKEKDAFERLDLSESTQEHLNESSISKTEFMKSSANEDLKIYQDTVANTANTSVKFEQLLSTETVEQACILKNGVCNCDISQCLDKSKHIHVASLYKCTSPVDSETSVSPTSDNLFMEFKEEKQSKDNLRHTFPSPGVRKVVENMCMNAGDGITEYEDKASEENKIILKDLTCILDDAPIQTEQIEKTNKIENQDVSELALTLEERKDLESAKAVQNLEEDIFQDFQHAQDSTSEDMIYYAVELSDDPETNEAVVNLESVELIERPIIIENTDTHEENILDTRIVQSHVDDQIEIQSEPLNEQIVETVDSKHNTELKINDALERITHMDSPVYCPVINDVNSKYLYGINEDSQSSIEVVEELVTDSIVSENVVLQQTEHHSEKARIMSEGTIVEGHSEKLPDILNSIEKHDTNKETVTINKNTESFVEFDCASVDLSSSFVDCKTYDEASNPRFQMESRPCLNISENLDTRKMCSGDERVTDLRFSELTGTCDLERTRISSDSNSFLQSYAECGMAVECNDEDDFIITQNELFDEDNVMDTT